MYLVKQAKCFLDDAIILTVGQYTSDGPDKLVEVDGAVAIGVPPIPFAHDTLIKQNIAIAADSHTLQQSKKFRKRYQTVLVQIESIEGLEA